MLHSNPGDYAWGQSGLDAIVTQVRPDGKRPTRWSPAFLRTRGVSCRVLGGQAGRAATGTG